MSKNFQRKNLNDSPVPTGYPEDREVGVSRSTQGYLRGGFCRAVNRPSGFWACTEFCVSWLRRRGQSHFCVLPTQKSGQSPFSGAHWPTTPVLPNSHGAGVEKGGARHRRPRLKGAMARPSQARLECRKAEGEVGDGRSRVPGPACPAVGAYRWTSHPWQSMRPPLLVSGVRFFGGSLVFTSV